MVVMVVVVGAMHGHSIKAPSTSVSQPVSVSSVRSVGECSSAAHLVVSRATYVASCSPPSDEGHSHRMAPERTRLKAKPPESEESGGGGGERGSVRVVSVAI